MIIFAGIDGTSDETETYGTTFANSFISRLAKNKIVNFSDTFYNRGPFMLGEHTSAIARAAFTWVTNKWKTGAASAVFLGGYSRGGAAVIEVAYWLKGVGIPVECLILFDAVDRSVPEYGGVGKSISDSISEMAASGMFNAQMVIGGNRFKKNMEWSEIWENRGIASNVKMTIHPMRDVPSSNSRLTFGNCGTIKENPGMPLLTQKFFVTHGGAGGVPWKTANNPYIEFFNSQSGSSHDSSRQTIWEFGEASPTNLTPAMDRHGSDLVEAWTFPKVTQAFESCRQQLSNSPKPPAFPGTLPGTQPHPIQPKMPKPGQRIYIVKPGDWLSKIAIAHYGDMRRTDEIYQANKHVIGPDPNRIKPGQKLIIP